LAGKGKAVKHPTQFEHGLFYANYSHSTLYFSGNASIFERETFWIGDIEKETIVMIENIKNYRIPRQTSFKD
jgi:hypothetical protein